MKTSTDLEYVKCWPKRFTWGKVIKFHKIGRFDILEHESWEPDEVSFSVYVDGNHIGRSDQTLEGAILIALAFGSIAEVNEAGHMAHACRKLLGPLR